MYRRFGGRERNPACPPGTTSPRIPGLKPAVVIDELHNLLLVEKHLPDMDAVDPQGCTVVQPFVNWQG